MGKRHNTSVGFSTNQIEQITKMKAYYSFHAAFYDYTRWTFLFGRKKLIRQLPFQNDDTFSVLEIGSGTGQNIQLLSGMYPNASFIGMDVSPDMVDKSRKKLNKADRKISWVNCPYSPEETRYEGKVDVILFSYMLTMVNPQWKSLVMKAKNDLKTGGFIAVVDFHQTKHKWFERHMSHNHVRMKGEILPLLQAEFNTLWHQTQLAYGGMWEYFSFIGEKAA